MQTYRKNSTDEVELEEELQQVEKKKKIKTALKLAFEYSIYGTCIIFNIYFLIMWYLNISLCRVKKWNIISIWNL